MANALRQINVDVRPAFPVQLVIFVCLIQYLANKFKFYLIFSFAHFQLARKTSGAEIVRTNAIAPTTAHVINSTASVYVLEATKAIDANSNVAMYIITVRIVLSRANVRMVVNAIIFRANANVRPVSWAHCARKNVRMVNTAKNASRNVSARTMANVIHKRENANAQQAGQAMCARIAAKIRTAITARINASAITMVIVIT